MIGLFSSVENSGCHSIVLNSPKIYFETIQKSPIIHFEAFQNSPKIYFETIQKSPMIYFETMPKSPKIYFETIQNDRSLCEISINFAMNRFQTL